MTVWPVRSIVRAPAGTLACAAGPTLAILPFSITIVWPSTRRGAGAIDDAHVGERDGAFRER